MTSVLPHSENLHPLRRQLKLAVWVVTGNKRNELTPFKDVRDAVTQSVRPDASSQFCE